VAESDNPTDDMPPSAESFNPSWPTFDEYEVIARIGRGGFGGVYKCRRRGGGGVVAIKVPHDDPDAIVIFDRELRMLLRLPRHPNVVGVLGRTEARLPSGRMLHALVMEWVRDGRPIHEYASKRGLDRRERLAMLATVARGLDHLHMSGVVHGDLTPNNILVGDDGRCVIVDLGGARERLDWSESHAIVTRAYASPEQLDGLDPHLLEQSSDIYSLGKVMAAVLMGPEVHTIPGEPSAAECFAFASGWSIRHYRQHPRWPGEAVADLIAEITEPDRAKRLIRADRVAERLDLLVRPLAARAESGVRRVVRSRLLHWSVAMLLAVVGGIALAVLLLHGYARLGTKPRLVLPPRALETLSDVVIVELLPGEPMAAAAKRLAAPADQAVGVNRRRHLFAASIERAWQLGASCVVFDVMLPDTPGTSASTKAIADAIKSTGGNMPVVTGAYEVWCTRPDEKILAAELQPLVYAVGSLGVFTDQGAGELFPVCFVRQGHRPALSLGAAAAAAHLRAAVELEPRRLAIGMGSVLFRTPWPSNGGAPPRRTELDLMGLRGELNLTKQNADAGPEDGDLMGVIALDLASVSRLCRQHTIPIDEFLDPSLTEVLRERLRNKIVVVWNGEVEGDRYSIVTESGEEVVTGGWKQAVVIQSLLSMPPRWPSTETLTLVLLLAAFAGAIAARSLHRWRREGRSSRAWMALAVLGGLLLATVAVVLWRSPGAIDFRIALIVLAVIGGMLCMIVVQSVHAAVAGRQTEGLTR